MPKQRAPISTRLRNKDKRIAHSQEISPGIYQNKTLFSLDIYWQFPYFVDSIKKEEYVSNSNNYCNCFIYKE